MQVIQITHPKIIKANYPGLESNASYDYGQKFINGFGGMISFELKGDVNTADEFINRTSLPICAPSLGGVETLIPRPSTTSHTGVSPEKWPRQGISDTLIRLSVGIENTEDLIADFGHALERLSE
jgi:cystathionine beta-lyase/cystathionine gamma-synthase